MRLSFTPTLSRILLLAATALAVGCGPSEPAAAPAASTAESAPTPPPMVEVTAASVVDQHVPALSVADIDAVIVGMQTQIDEIERILTTIEDDSGTSLASLLEAAEIDHKAAAAAGMAPTEYAEKINKVKEMHQALQLSMQIRGHYGSMIEEASDEERAMIEAAMLEAEAAQQLVLAAYPAELIDALRERRPQFEAMSAQLQALQLR